jgi:hypothetical protein
MTFTCFTSRPCGARLTLRNMINHFASMLTIGRITGESQTFIIINQWFVQIGNLRILSLTTKTGVLICLTAINATGGKS